MDQQGSQNDVTLHDEKGLSMLVKEETVSSNYSKEKSAMCDVQKRVVSRVYGQHEIHVSTGLEVDLHKHVIDCPKNPGHAEFFPIQTLSLDSLPEGYRDIVQLDFIKSVADLTVRVDVKMTSPNRPKFHPDTSEPYPFSEGGGEKTPRYGSGEVNVLHFTEGRGLDESGNSKSPLGLQHVRDYKTCPCDNCRESPGRKRAASPCWWEISLFTAAHVVYDEVEASHTSCRLFYDGKSSPGITLDNLKVQYVNVQRDWCALTHVTCDATLGDRIYKLSARRSHLWRDVCAERRNEDNLSFIVSHPHGCPKMVSFGRWENNYDAGEFNDDFVSTQLTYTTCTCPGSSGASVHCVGFIGGHVHCGTLTSGLNYSGVGFHHRKK